MPTPTPTAPSANPTTTVAASVAGVKMSSMANAVYVGNDPPDFVAYQNWLGHPADGVQLFTGRNGWADWTGSLGWLIDRWKAVNATIYWSIPLMSQDSTLIDAAAGKYNGYYTTAAMQMAAAYPNAAIIYVRTGWEFNGDWQPWSAIGKADHYKAAYRQFVSSFRSVSSKFVFEWAPNIGDHGMSPEDAYPGDDVVDIIGVDFYYDHRWDPKDPDAGWQWMLNQKYGLNWHRNFAAAHNKPVAYAEWGVSDNNDSAYVRNVAAWFKSQNFVYQSYWNSDAAYTGKLSDDQYPNITPAYKDLVTK